MGILIDAKIISNCLLKPNSNNNRIEPRNVFINCARINNLISILNMGLDN